MGRSVARVLCALALIAVVVIVDILFFRHNVAERWMANAGIVVVFAAFGFLILRVSGGSRDDSPPTAPGA
jgi:phosphate starvation-inducible membrane PsiE